MKEIKVVSKRFGVVDPQSIESYIKLDGYKALKKALTMNRAEIIDEIEKSKIRGRGGAGFPSHIKLRGLAAETGYKYLVCNADEGEPGNFKDRFILENDPHQLIEGMIIAAYATGAFHGYIYIRGEYQKAIALAKNAIAQAQEKGFLGEQILGKDFNFTLEVRSGAGSYVCGEELAMLESIEGKPSKSRVKPPFPTQVGVFGRPTLINNVETLCNFNNIILNGAEEFAKIGTESSRGTKLISLSGNVKNRGIFEVPFGTTLKEAIFDLGQGVKDGRKIKMVQLGGASGPIIPGDMLDLTIDFDRLDEFGKTGSGAIIVIDDRFDLFDILLNDMEFFMHESCGKCTPCREGHVQVVNIINKFKNNIATKEDLENLEILATVITDTSLCGLGQTSMTSILTTLKYFRDEYLAKVEA